MPVGPPTGIILEIGENFLFNCNLMCPLLLPIPIPDFFTGKIHVAYVDIIYYTGLLSYYIAQLSNCF